MALLNKNLLERARRALFSRAVFVPSIEERERRVVAAMVTAQKTAEKIEFFSTPAAMPVFAAMLAHRARREARQRARKKV